MSAESPRRVARAAGQIVRPQPVSDKSVMESVVDFIHDVVPQAYGTAKTEENDAIIWVRCEYSDINDPSAFPDGRFHNGNTPPLLLILGYSNGVQIWTILANGEAQEVLSWRQGAVKCMMVLPTPKPVFNTHDIYAQKRPLVAICDSASAASQQFCSVVFISLRTADQVHSIKFQNPVCNIQANKRVVVVAFQERIAVFDACTFKDRFTISSCYPCPGPNPNPTALGTRWLAYADRKLVCVHQTCGGMVGDGVQSYAATVIHAAKTITKGLTMFGETVASSLTGSKPHAAHFNKKDQGLDSPQPGIVTIVDIETVGEGEVNVHEDSEGEGIIAHFPAHAEPVTAMSFDPSGILLLTADKLGHNFHVFRVLSHPSSSSLGAVHHLYTLYRGDTTAKVQDIAFSADSRWVAVSTLRGTTHIFPITPYGGPISVRTHTSPRVVNRLSRFHKSAGLEEIPQVSSCGRSSPVLSASPGSAGAQQNIKSYDSHPSISYHNTMCGRMGNPRLPPYPHPTLVSPLYQLRQPLTFSSLSSAVSKSPPGKSRSGSLGSVSNGNIGGGGHVGGCSTSGAGNTVGAETNMSVAATFAPLRAWLASSPSVGRDKGDKRPVDALYIIGCNGNLVEYYLEPKTATLTGTQKTSDDSPVELEVQARAQWTLVSRLSSNSEVRPPLAPTNPLIVAQEIVARAQLDKDLMQTGNNRNRSYQQQQQQSHGANVVQMSCGEVDSTPDDSWLSQVEIITHVGPHRRLWMGPQFQFKTFQHSANTTILSSSSSALLSQSPESVSSQTPSMDIFTEELDLESLGVHHPTRSNPVAMPSGRQSIPLLIEAGSAGSFEQSPGLLEVCGGSWPESGGSFGANLRGASKHMEEQLREHLADAMMESPVKETGSGGEPMCRGSSSEFQGSMEELSSCSSHSGSVGHTFDARSSPPQSMDHVLVFPTDTNGSPISMS